MNATEWVGVIAGCFTTGAFAPQALAVLRTRSVKDISLAMYAAFVSGIALWLLYGALIQSVSLIVFNAITLVLAGSVLVMKILFTAKKEP